MRCLGQAWARGSPWQPAVRLRGTEAALRCGSLVAYNSMAVLERSRCSEAGRSEMAKLLTLPCRLVLLRAAWRCVASFRCTREARFPASFAARQASRAKPGTAGWQPCETETAIRTQGVAGRCRALPRRRAGVATRNARRYCLCTFGALLLPATPPAARRGARPAQPAQPPVPAQRPPATRPAVRVRRVPPPAWAPARARCDLWGVVAAT